MEMKRGKDQDAKLKTMMRMMKKLKRDSVSAKGKTNFEMLEMN